MDSIQHLVRQAHPAMAKSGIATILLDASLSVVHGTAEFFALLDMDAPKESDSLPSLASFLHEEDQALFRQLASTSSSSEQPVSLSFRFHIPQGAPLPIAFSGHLVTLKNHRFGLWGIFMDLSELEQTQKALEASHHELQSITNAIDGGVAKIRMDSDFTILYANEGFYKFFDQEPHSPLLPSARNLVYPEDLPHIVDTVQQQLRLQGKVATEFRVQRGKRSPKWMFVRATQIGMDQGYPVLLCIFVDITALKTAQLQLQLEQERQRILAALSRDILFEYDLEADVFSYTNPHESLVAEREVVPHFLKSEMTHTLIHPDDLHLISEILQAIRKGHTSYSHVIRIMQNDGEYYWYLAYVLALQASDGTPTHAMGKLVDIHKEKEKELSLRRELQYDPLTKLFNQIATKNLVESILVRNPIDRHLMFIIDIDNFKQANDQYGHLFGNSVLVEIAKTLRQVFRQEDLIGRIGGDEFLVFLNHLHNEDEAVRLAQQLTHRLHQAVIQPHQDYTISLSIGFSTYPDNGTSYEELFTAADFALYRSKRRGKDRIEGAIPPEDATS